MNFDLMMAKFSFSAGKKTRLMRQMQRLNKAGISTTASLDMLYALYSQNGKKPKDSTAIAVNEWRKKLKSGRGLANSLSGWVNKSEEMIIEAGEQSNKLSDAMADALEASSAARRIRKTITSALAYPVVMLIALCVMLYGFSTGIVPTFAEIVPPEQWTGNAARMYGLSQFVINWLPYLAVAIVGLGVAAWMSLPKLKGPIRTTLDRLPPYSIYKVIAGASFMMSLRGFIAAGITVPEALRRIGRGSSPYVRSRTESILAQVNAGHNLGDAMARAKQNFPDPDINGEISIYSGLDDFARNLDVLAKEWIEGAVERTQQAAKVLSNIMLVLLAGTIMFMALSMFELQDIITRSTGV
jgi:type II secretory pathway component PulF